MYYAGVYLRNIIYLNHRFEFHAQITIFMWGEGVFDPLSLTVLHTEKISLLQFLVAEVGGGVLNPVLLP